MTREEAKAILKGFMENPLFSDIPKVCRAFDMAIKALEQQLILDKIRAEIEEKYGNYDICEWLEDYDYDENNISEYRLVGNVSDILQIIDKYKTESEDKE